MRSGLRYVFLAYEYIKIGEKEMNKEEKNAKFGGKTYEEWCAQLRLRLMAKVPKNLGDDELEETGDLPTKRNRIRARHIERLRKYRDQKAPGCHIHHEWIPGTAEYRGVAFVDAKAHIKGVIKIIEVIDGKITLQIEKRQKCLDPVERYQRERRREFMQKYL